MPPLGFARKEEPQSFTTDITEKKIWENQHEGFRSTWDIGSLSSLTNLLP
jgi:hypothetical protein